MVRAIFRVACGSSLWSWQKSWVVGPLRVAAHSSSDAWLRGGVSLRKSTYERADSREPGRLRAPDTRSLKESASLVPPRGTAVVAGGSIVGADCLRALPDVQPRASTPKRSSYSAGVGFCPACRRN